QTPIGAREARHSRMPCMILSCMALFGIVFSTKNPIASSMAHSLSIVVLVPLQVERRCLYTPVLYAGDRLVGQ
ncbi:MAG: hypothetical protein ACI8RD_013720, partial [Bacillariaceae sp.]